MPTKHNPTVISVLNMKGGVGKTTLSVNIAYLLAKMHQKRILIIDIDPQFNATQYLADQQNILNHFKNNKTIYDILQPEKEQELSITEAPIAKIESININNYIINIFNNKNSKLDLIPSFLKLAYIDQGKRGTENRLKNFINTYCQHYDFILIDCPPTLSVYTLSAYLASTHYLIPIKPDLLSSIGLSLLERGLKEYEDDYNHKLKLIGIVFTMVTQTNLATETMAEIGKSKNVFDSYSSNSTKVANSVSSIGEFYNKAPVPKHQQEFIEIVNQLLTRI